MTHRILLRGTIALVAVGALAACGSDSKSSSTTAAAATTTAAAATTAAPTTAKAAATTAAGAPTTTKSTATTAAGSSPSSGTASLSLHDDATLGKILVDSEGYTMYLFTKDTGTTSVCTAKCAAAWPPAVVTGTPTAGDGVDASKLSASAQPDGTMQLTYNGHLLYRFAGDSGPGMTNGQDVQEVWYVLDASGNQVG